MIDINEEQLLRQLRELKDIEIERLLTQYGTSLAETREMYPQLMETLKARETLGMQDLFLTPSEAADVGLQLQEGWMLKLSRFNGGYKSSFITPMKWEITEDDLYISPQGEQFSRADLQTLLSMPSGDLGPEFPIKPLTISELTEEGKGLYQEYQQAGGELDVGGWVNLREQQYAETEEIFGKVFPEQDIAEVLTYMQEQPEAFLTDIREIGPTEEMVSFLQYLEFEDEAGVARHFTDEEIQGLFGMEVVPQYIPESKLKDIRDAFIAGGMGFIQGIETYLFTNPPTKPTPETANILVNAWATHTTPIAPGFTYEYAMQKYEQGLQSTVEGYLRRREEQQQYWISHPELAPKPEYLVNPLENPSLLKDPGYWGYTIASSLAYSLAVMGTMMIPVVGIPAGFALAGMPEAGHMIDELVDRGVSLEEATEPAQWYGIAAGAIEGASNLPFLGLVFKPFKAAMQPFWKTVTKGFASGVMKAIVSGVIITQSEALEEVLTQVIHNAIVKHYDETQSLFEGVSHAYIQAAIATLPFAGIGGYASYQTFRANLPAQTGQQYDALVERFQKVGLTEEQAQVQAANEMAKTPEGEAQLTQAIGAARLEYLESQGVKSVEELIPKQELAHKILDEIKIAEEIKVTPPTAEVPTRFRREIPPEPLPDYLKAVPETEVGMPEAGLQAGIPGMAAAEVVRPQPTGKLVQARIDDYLRLRDYNAKAVTDRIAEIKKLLETPGRLPKGQGTKGDLRLELARLDAQQELDAVENIADLDALIREVENELGRRSLPGQGEWARSGIALARHPRKPNIFPEYTSRQLEEMRNVYLQAREGMKAEVPVLKPTPKPEIPPEIINRVKTDPTPASDDIIVKKFIECIKDAKPAREITEALKHEELSKRSAIFASILQGGEGYKAFEKAKGALRGFLPQGEYILDLQKFGITDAEIERMIDRIRLDKSLQPFQKLNTYEAFTNLIMGAIPTEGELLLLEREFGPEFTKAIMDKMPAREKAIRVIQDLANVPRTLLATCDLSATLRQGALLAFGQPVQFAKGFKAQLQAVFSEKNFKVINEIVHNNIYADKAEQHKLYIAPIEESVKIAAREEAFMGRLIEKVPIIGHIVRASERAYITMLNVLRIETWAYYCHQWEGTGKRSGDYDKLASFINHATGRGDLGSFSRAAPWLSATFFSPRFIMSRVQVPLDLINTTPAVRKVIARNLASFVAVGLLAQILAELGGGETEKDPRSTDFGKIKIGNTRIDFWAGFQPYVRVIAQIISEERKATRTGEVYKVDPIDIGVNFFRSKLAPIPGLLWDLKSGKTFIGEELTPENAEKIIYEKLTPMAVQDLIDAVKDNNIWAALGYGALAMLGVGIQTYGYNWETAELKLGLPERPENLPYTIENEVYDVKDYYSEISGMIGGATYEMLSDKKVPELVLSVAKAKDILREITLLPNKRLTSINADSAKGDTYEQYRVQWLARQKITSPEELKQFDKDYPDAYLGNITQAQYALLVEYHSLPESEKADFLGRHPELYINPREEWLRTHPEENALLTLWGKADIYSLEAQSKVASLAKTLGIPENALVMKDLDAVTQLKLKNQSLFDLLEAYGGLDDTFKGPDGLTARDIAIQQLYLDNPEFRDDERRIDALNVGTKDNPTLEEMVEAWVERGKVADEFGPSSAEMKLWLIDNKEIHQWALENALLTDTGEDWNENILRLQVNYGEDFDKYDDYGDITSLLYISNDTERTDAREAMKFNKQGMTSFGVAHYTINALQKNIPENLVTTYVDYYGIRKKEGVDYSSGWYEDDWFLMENEGFYNTMVSMGLWQEKDFTKVPTRQVYSLYKTYMTLPTGQPRLDFRSQHLDLDAWLVLAKKYTPIGNR